MKISQNINIGNIPQISRRYPKIPLEGFGLSMYFLIFFWKHLNKNILGNALKISKKISRD